MKSFAGISIHELCNDVTAACIRLFSLPSPHHVRVQWATRAMLTVHCALQDLSGRPHLSFDVETPTDRIGTYDTQLVEHFFQSVANTSGMTLHIRHVPASCIPRQWSCMCSFPDLLSHLLCGQRGRPDTVVWTGF